MPVRLYCKLLVTACLLLPAGCYRAAPASKSPSPPPVEIAVPLAPEAEVSGSDTLVSESTKQADKADTWTELFEGKSLGNWISTQFGGEGDVTVEDGCVMLARGDDMTGITWRGEPPAKMNYEIEVEAKRVDGNDFFCGLTFPVGDDPCSLICGGWGGTVTGLSSLDGNDASSNETTQGITYDNGRWYKIRLRVTTEKIETWLDDKPIISVETAAHRIGIRPEVDPSRPLGIATWRTTAAIRAIRLRNLDAEPK
jgi:hypothetical protein